MTYINKLHVSAYFFVFIIVNVSYITCLLKFAVFSIFHTSWLQYLLLLLNRLFHVYNVTPFSLIIIIPLPLPLLEGRLRLRTHLPGIIIVILQRSRLKW